MREDEEKGEFDWINSEPVHYHKKRDQPVSAAIPVFLFLVFGLTISAMFGVVALLPLGLAAILLFVFLGKVTRLPIWFYLIFFLVTTYLTWNFLSSGPVTSNPIASWIYRNSGLDFRGTEETVLVDDADFKPEPGQTTQVPSEGTSTETPKDSINAAPTVAPEKPEAAAAPSETTAPATPANVDSKAFEAFLDKGLKAVEDEQYDVANQNFKNAFKANPGHPRLKELAAEYKRTADERCQDFKNANAKELSHIPNNYYQYAASLTQTVPLKCD